MGRKHIWILGTGPGGLSAAYGLTFKPNWKDDYDITFIQVGWRGGGMCTSGRFGSEQRILLNGTHYLFGCYDNTFSMMRTAYDELNKAGDFKSGTFSEQLLPRNRLVCMQFFQGNWHRWDIRFPPNQRRPGVDETPLTPKGIVEQLLHSAVSAIEQSKGIDALRGSEQDTLWTRLSRAVGSVLGNVEAAADQAMIRLAKEAMARGDLNALVPLLKHLRHWLWRLLKDSVDTHLELRRLWILVDLALTNAIGMIEDDVFVLSKLDALDKEEYRAWLRRHGGSEIALWSPPMATWYDAIAAYEDGDPNRPNISTTVGLKAMLTSFIGYKGAFAYQLGREVGESLTAPIIQALMNRGVKFRFFHRIWNVVPKNGRIVRLDFEKQVELLNPDVDSYDPFGNFRGMRTWPGYPRQELIKTPGTADMNLDSFYKPHGKIEPMKLDPEKDVVVFAMPVATIPVYCQEILKENKHWREMVDHVGTTETQSLRLYHTQTLPQMGWTGPTPITSGYVWPFSTWEDAGELTPIEGWPPEETPAAVSTVFGGLPRGSRWRDPNNTGYPDRQLAVAYENARTFCERDVGALWPGATGVQNPTGINWDSLIDLDHRQDEKRLDFQAIMANSGPTSSYTMGLAGSLPYRLRTNETGYQNLFFAGDWVRNGSDLGCIESAVMSGLEASRAICGTPKHIPNEFGPFGADEEKPFSKAV